VDLGGRQDRLAVGRKKRQQPLGDDGFGLVEGVGEDSHVAVDVDPGERFIQDEDSRIRAGQLVDIAGVVDDLRRQLRHSAFGSGVLLSVGSRQTPVPNPEPRGLGQRVDATEGVEYVGVGVAGQGAVDQCADLLDAGLTRTGIQRFEPLFGVLRDSPPLEQRQRVVVQRFGAVGGEKAPGVVVAALDRPTGDGGGPALGDTRGRRDRQHVAGFEGGFGGLELGERRGRLPADAGNRFELHSPAGLSGSD